MSTTPSQRPQRRHKPMAERRSRRRCWRWRCRIGADLVQSAWRSALLCSAVAFHCPAAQSPSSSSNRPAEICWVVSASLWSIWSGGSGKVCGRGPSHCCANCNKQEFKAEGNTHTHTCTLTIHIHTHKHTVCKTIGKANRKHENCNNSNNSNYILIKPQTHLKTISNKTIRPAADWASRNPPPVIPSCMGCRPMCLPRRLQQLLLHTKCCYCDCQNIFNYISFRYTHIYTHTHTYINSRVLTLKNIFVFL